MEGDGKITVLYDSECPVCRFSMHLVQKLDGSGSFIFRGTGSVDQPMNNIPVQELRNRIHTVDQHGSMLNGPRSLALVFRKIPVFYPLALFLRIADLMGFADPLYDFISRNRYLLGFHPSSR
ncbi:MAG: thiol-disulfide oxidoreductase DCC family protein [Thermoplasmataceae archaeon]